jgi:hypothetical protein
MAEKPVTPALPIVPYPSFVAALDHFYEAGGAPSELHSSVFPKTKFSGTTIALLVRAFKQLGMADDQGKTRHDQIDPLINPDTRKPALQKLLQDCYGTLIALPVATASPNQFNRWFDDFHVNAEDTRKAKTFFLYAARANDVPVSAFITNKYKSRTRTPGKPAANRDKKPRVTKGKDPTIHDKPPVLETATGESRSVDLRESGAQLTLTVSKGVMQLSRLDRQLVLDLIAAIETYEK